MNPRMRNQAHIVVDHNSMRARSLPLLSKSRYLAGLQCYLRLWHQCYNRDLIAISTATEALFETGHEVGELATRLYPGGIRIGTDPLRHQEAVRATQQALDKPDVPAIYEAAFLYDDVRVKVDILERLDNGKWNIIEVKSSTSVKDEHVPDVAVQYYVLKGAGLHIERVFLMHLNNRYVYDGAQLDLEGLFISSDLTEHLLSYQPEIPSKLAELRDMLGAPMPPAICPSRNCHRPHTCEFWEHCRKAMSAHWVMELKGIGQGKLDQLMDMDISDIRDLPESFPLSEIQGRIRACVKNDEEHISDQLKDQLEAVEYPAHFLDFETLGLAIPRYARTRPYQTIPFQWSDHILHENGTIKHQEYLCEADRDPREQLAQALLNALGSKGTIFMYTTYERDVIKKLAEDLPLYREQLLATLDRLNDLHKIISTLYYHPQFHGSFSLKSVLPALLPEMSYENLSIQEGQGAALEYLRMIDPSTGPEEKKKIRRDLLAYCAQDTLAMVRIREELLQKSS